MKLTIEIPGLPPRECSPNARVFWATKARLTREYRNEVSLCAYAASGGTGAWQPLGHARIVVTFIVPDRRRRDKTNMAASFKAGLDGLVDAGIIKDDSYECCYDQYHIVYEKGVSKTIVEVEAI